MRKRFGADAAVAYHEGDAENLPLADGSVDHVFANMCLHHVPDPARAVVEMARILKPGGKLVLTDLDATNSRFYGRNTMTSGLDSHGKTSGGGWPAPAWPESKPDCAGHNCCAQSQCGQDAANVGIFLAYGEKWRRD